MTLGSRTESETESESETEEQKKKKKKIHPNTYPHFTSVKFESCSAQFLFLLFFLLKETL